MILLSVMLLGDDLSGLSALGCALSMLGSAWYGYVSLVGRQQEVSQQAQEACGLAGCHKDGDDWDCWKINFYDSGAHILIIWPSFVGKQAGKDKLNPWRSME